MTCEACDRAGRGIWSGLYLASCIGCRARSIARGSLFAAAMKNPAEDREPLYQQMQRVLHEIPLADARRVVWDAWQADQAIRETVGKSNDR